MNGSHISLYLLTPTTGSHSSESCHFFRHCLRKHIQTQQTHQSGLTSSFIAIVGCPCLNKILGSPPQWYQLSPHPSEELDTLLNALTSGEMTGCHGNSNDRDMMLMCNTVHSLLDELPTTNSLQVFDVCWLVPDPEQLPAPLSAVHLYGVLLRTVRWCHAHLHLVTSLPSTPHTSPRVCEWRQALKGLSVTCVSEWGSPSGVVWRGCLHCTEHKVCKQATHTTFSYPGFSLRLLPLTTHPSLIPSLLEGVGLHSPSQFIHLELLFVVEMRTFPLFWLSPFHCKLCVDDSWPCVSSKLLPHLLFPEHSEGKTGLILCLSTRSHNSGRTKAGDQPIKNKTTVEWVEFMQGLEEDSMLSELEDKGPTPLEAYSTGPLLLVTQAANNSVEFKSCDAWFLWRPEMIKAECVSGFMIESRPVTDDTGVLISDSVSTKLLKGGLVSHTNSTRPPTDWPEMKALRTYEWLLRKMVRRVATADLMFGHMIAPPPTDANVQSDSLDISDILSCFNEHGSPSSSQLSPIAMSESAQLIKIYNPVESCLTYDTFTPHTPSQRRRYHGINYCLTEEDSSIDARLTKIQQRYLFSERIGHCNPVLTPRAERAKQQARRRGAESVTLNAHSQQMSEGSSSVPPDLPVKRTPPSSKTHYAQSRTGVSLMKSPVINITRVPRRQLLGGVVREAIASGSVGSKVSGTRKSPRQHKGHSKSEIEEGRKAKLSQEVLTALKREGMSRQHPAFKKCYSKLFSVSKTFLKDSGVRMGGGAAAQKAEIQRVVKLNVKNVLNFELSKLKSTTSQQ